MILALLSPYSIDLLKTKSIIDSSTVIRYLKYQNCISLLSRNLLKLILHLNTV